jgi:hypothetical protein
MINLDITTEKTTEMTRASMATATGMEIKTIEEEREKTATKATGKVMEGMAMIMTVRGITRITRTRIAPGTRTETIMERRMRTIGLTIGKTRTTGRSRNHRMAAVRHPMAPVAEPENPTAVPRLEITAAISRIETALDRPVAAGLQGTTVPARRVNMTISEAASAAAETRVTE